jgi:MoxR-like ATPase
MSDPASVCDAIIENVADVYVGERTLLERLLAGALADGHVLFEDYPGLGKTLLVKVFARTVGVEARRVQFTPDMLPADILGTKVWNQADQAFELVKGPVFSHVLLADEINRAPPKTQAALLESMEERQVTIEGETLPLDPPFFVLATQNPIEQEGTYPLPEAQLDRFLVRLRTGYPSTPDRETEILERRVDWETNDPSGDVEPVTDLETFRRLQRTVEEEVFIHRAVMDYITRIVRALREHETVDVGPSPRGALALLRLGRAIALVRGRGYVTPDDVKSLAGPALGHRTILSTEQVLDGVAAEDVVAKVVDGVAVPTRYEEGD